MAKVNEREVGSFLTVCLFFGPLSFTSSHAYGPQSTESLY